MYAVIICILYRYTFIHEWKKNMIETSARLRTRDIGYRKKRCKKSTVIVLPKQYYNQQKTAVIMNFMSFTIMIMIITITYIPIRV